MGYRSVYRDDLFSGQTIVITGGGSGIGRCVAHEVTALGAHAVLIGRTESKLVDVCKEIAEDGGSASYYSADIRDEERVKDVVATIVKERGQIDGLFNNAGGQFSAPLAEMSTNGFSAVVNSNLIGGMVFAREVYTQGMINSGGAIVNMATTMHNGTPNFAHTAAARMGMINLTKTMACEWAHAGVRVNAISPGFIESSGADTYNSGTEAENKWIESMRAMGKYVPLRRKGIEAEITSAIVFLFCEGASYVTGENFVVDGGMSLGVPWHRYPPVTNPRIYDGFHRAVVPEVLREVAKD